MSYRHGLKVIAPGALLVMAWLTMWTCAHGREAIAGQERSAPSVLHLQKTVEQLLEEGHLDAARQMLVEARGLNAGRLGDEANAIDFLEGSICYLSADYGCASSRFSALLERLPDSDRLTPLVWSNLGNVHLVQHRYREAHTAFQHSMELADSAPAVMLKAHLNDVRALQALGEHEHAWASLQRLISRLQKLPDDTFKLDGLLSAAQRIEDSGDSAAVEDAMRMQFDLLDAARRIATVLSDDARLADSLLALARCYRRAGRANESMTLARRALFYAQAADSVGLEVQAYWLLARLYGDQGHEQQAVDAYRKAVKTVGITPAPDWEQRMARQRSPVEDLLEEAADHLLMLSARVDDKERKHMLLTEVRHIVEQARADSLRHYFQDDCIAELRRRTRGIEEIDPRTLVIYPVALEDRLELVLSSAEQMWQVTVPVRRQALDFSLQNLRASLQRTAGSIYRQNASEVYGWLVEPLEAVLAHVRPDTLVFVPNATLQMVPLAALYDGRQFLVERYSVATIPGLSLTDPRALGDVPMRLLTAGVTEAINGFPGLPHAGKEVRALAHRYDSPLLLDEEFTLQAFEDALRDESFPIVHIAAHGRFDPLARQSYIQAWDGRITLDSIQSLLAVGRSMNTPVELLTLSACETAVGDTQAALGLSGLAIKSGARSAVASLWQISDAATQQLMEVFYQQLENPDNSRARALQQAQQALLHDPRYQHPAYWSAFVLVGNWQ